MALQLDRHQKLAYGIVGLLVVLLIGVLVYMQVGISEDGGAIGVPVDDVATIGGLRADEANQPLDVGVLQNPQYQGLNRSLLDAGRLPVPPPASRGKPNPFGL